MIEPTSSASDPIGSPSNSAPVDPPQASAATTSSIQAPDTKISQSTTMQKIGALLLSWKALGFMVAVAGGFWAGSYFGKLMQLGPFFNSLNSQYLGCLFSPSVDFPKDAKPTPLALRGDEPQFGAKDPLVTVVEFSDFECPYCIQAAPPLMNAVKKFPADVQLQFKHHPLNFHKNAKPAAMVAWAAHQQGKFWEMQAYLFEHHGDIQGARAYLESLGGDGEKFAKDAVSDAAEAAIASDLKAGKSADVHGTPAFWINGHLYGGAMGECQFTQILEHELKAAREVEKTGVPRNQVLEKLVGKSAAASGISPGGEPAEKPDAAPTEKPDGKPAPLAS